MILHGYCYFNRKGGFYTAPFFNQYDTGVMLELIGRSFKNASKDEKNFLLESDFIYLGKFDDHCGDFDLLKKPTFLRNFVEEEIKNEEE